MRPGRKRKLNGHRQPNGAIRTYEDPAHETIARRVRDHIWRDVRHPFHGFPLGIMFAMRIIDDQEFEAGKKWALLMVRILNFRGMPSPNCRAQNFSGATGKALSLPPTDDQLRQYRREQRRLNVLNTHIMGAHPQAFPIMRRLCLQDAEIMPREQTIAKIALRKLALLMHRTD